MVTHVFMDGKRSNTIKGHIIKSTDNDEFYNLLGKIQEQHRSDVK